MSPIGRGIGLACPQRLIRTCLTAASDGDTDIDDLLLLISLWGTNNPDGDLNGDGTVDINDLLILLGDFGG